MIPRIALSVMFLTSMVLAEATKAPATRPATQPVVNRVDSSKDVVVIGLGVGKGDVKLVSRPATQPSPAAKQPSQPAQPANPTQQANNKNNFPSAKDMAERWAKQKQSAKDLLKIAYIDLDQPIAEKPAAFALFADNTLTLHLVISRLQEARDDPEVRAVLINLGTTSFNLAQAMEIRDALVDIRKAGKRAFVYSDAYDTAAYVAATGATDICMMSGGEIMIPGVGLETMFAKGLLDKVGVKADYVQIGQYKGADEQYTRTEPSKELRGELNKILDSLYDQIVDGIANHRNISRNDVVDMINNVMLNGRAAKQRKFVDHLVDQDGLRDLLKAELHRDVDLLQDYGVEGRQPPDFSNPFALLASLTKKDSQADLHLPKIAIIYAEGVIIDGEAGDGVFSGGGQVGSEDLRKAFRKAVKDDSIKAIVLRIDSPGGSAMASEVMWQAARRAAGKKPLIISIGSMAASGGYYLASAGDHIFADPTAIVGSIGVVGGKFVTKDLFNWVGLKTESFARGANADLFGMNEPFTEQQRRMVTNWMQQTYEQFTDRVMSQRGKKIKDIDEIARGRVFLAKQARSLGMVDEIGGIDKAIAFAAEKVKLSDKPYEIKTIPGTRTLGDILRGEGPEARFPFQPKVSIEQSDVFQMLAPSSARLLRQQVQMLRLLQQRPVLLVSPYVFTVK